MAQLERGQYIESDKSRRDPSLAPFLARRIAPIVIFYGGIGILAAACGGSASGPENPKPTATRMSEVLPTALAPTPTAQIEATATPEIFEPVSEMELIKKNVLGGISTIEDTHQQDKQSVVLGFEGISQQLELAEQNPLEIEGLINHISVTAQALSNLACASQNKENADLASLWRDLRSFAEDYTRMKLIQGILVGIDPKEIRGVFPISLSCENQHLLEIARN